MCVWFQVRFNVTFHQATVILSAVAFGTMVRHVPYQQRRYCKTHSCGHVSHDTMVGSRWSAALITAVVVWVEVT